MKIAVAQYKPVFLNLMESLTKAIQIIREASNEGAELIAFPETWLPGYPVWLDSAPKAASWDFLPAKELFAVLMNNSIQLNSKEFNLLFEESKKSKIIVIIGVNERKGKTLYNSIFTFLPNGNFYVHRKLVPTYSEKLIWGKGDGSGIHVAESDFGNIGSLICWEHWMPLLKAAMYSKNEFLHVALWPSVNDLHLLASRHYAFEGKCFVLAVGTILKKQDVLDGYDSLGHSKTEVKELLDSIQATPNDFLQNGGSCIIAPDTSLICHQVFEEELTIYKEINQEMVLESLLTHDADGHYSRPDIFNLLVKTGKMNNVNIIE